MAIVPDRKNLRESNKKGGASNIDILADVNALDQIIAKETPSIKSRIFIYKYQKKGYQKVAKFLIRRTFLRVYYIF